MDLGIAGKVALVTGGSRGLGRFSALALAREGAQVAICARSEERLNATVEELRALTSSVGVVADMASADGPQAVFDATISELGPVDILVNNVGGSTGRDALSTSDEEWYNAFDTNIMGAIRLMRLVVPGMTNRSWGRIVNISSIFGREHGGRATYMTAKAGLIALTKHMALDLAKEGVLVNSVAPGSITFAGGNWERFQTDQPPEVVEEFIARNLPMGKFGWPEPIADTVAFLCSERASLITGATINVDGGQSHSLI